MDVLRRLIFLITNCTMKYPVQIQIQKIKIARSKSVKLLTPKIGIILIKDYSSNPD